MLQPSLIFYEKFSVGWKLVWALENCLWPPGMGLFSEPVDCGRRSWGRSCKAKKKLMTAPILVSWCWRLQGRLRVSAQSKFRTEIVYVLGADERRWDAKESASLLQQQQQKKKNLILPPICSCSSNSSSSRRSSNGEESRKLSPLGLRGGLVSGFWSLAMEFWSLCIIIDHHRLSLCVYPRVVK